MWLKIAIKPRVKVVNPLSDLTPLLCVPFPKLRPKFTSGCVVVNSGFLGYFRGVVLAVRDGYIVDHCCLRLDGRVALTVRDGYIVYHYCLRFNRGVILAVRDCYIVDHHCLRFDRGVGLTFRDDIVNHYCLWFDRGVVLTVRNGYIVDHYCLGLDRGVTLTGRDGCVVDQWNLIIKNWYVQVTYAIYFCELTRESNYDIVLDIYCATCLIQTLNKPESCLTRTFNEVPM